MKRLTLIAFLFTFGAFAQVYNVERIIGPTHLAMFALDPANTMQMLGLSGFPSSDQKGILIALMSDDATVASFDILLVYKSDGVIRTKTLQVAKQSNPSSAWTSVVVWLGQSDFTVLSVEITERHPIAVFSMP